MAKIERNTQEIFANLSQNSETAQFGSMVTGSPVFSKDLSIIQSNPAFAQGFQDAVKDDLAPYLEETNSLFYMLTKQIAYVLQEGVPEFDFSTTYYLNSYCKLNGVIYKSLQDNNLNNNPTTTVNFWEELSHSPYKKGELKWFTLPQNDAFLVPADGRILQGASPDYSSFVSFVASLQNSNPELFTTENSYNQSINNNGVCGKYVYNAQANTLRIPTIKGYVEGTTTENEIGDFTEAGLPNITGQFQASDDNNNNITYGAFKVSGSYGNAAGGGSSEKLINFDASRSNAVYKDNYNKVQTNSIKLFFYIAIK